MITNVGYVVAMNGNEFNLSVTNASAQQLLDTNEKIEKCSILITSPLSTNYFDIGTPSIMVSDTNGALMRLTYTFKPGNGLDIDNSINKDVLTMHIDHKTIRTKDKALFADIAEMVNYNESFTFGSVNNYNYLKLKPEGFIDNRTIKLGSRLLDISNDNVLNFNNNYNNTYKLSNDIIYVDKTVFTDDIYLTTRTIEDISNNILTDMGVSLNKSHNPSDYGEIYLSYWTKLSLKLENLVDNETIVADTAYGVISDALGLNKRLYANENGDDCFIKVNSSSQSGSGDVSLVPSNTVTDTPTPTSYYDDIPTPSTYPTNRAAEYAETTNSNSSNTYPAGGSDDTENSNIMKKFPKLSVNTQKLDVATNLSLGVIKYDNSTIKKNNNKQIYVDTSKLTKAAKNTIGVVSIDNDTIKAKNPTIKNTIYVDYNAVAPKQNSITYNNGKLVLNTEYATIASYNEAGLVKIDNNTIKSERDGRIYVDYTTIPKAHKNTFGVVASYDNSVTIEEGKIKVSDTILTTINMHNEYINELVEKINTLNTKIEELILSTQPVKETAYMLINKNIKMSLSYSNVSGDNGPTNYMALLNSYLLDNFTPTQLYNTPANIIQFKSEKQSLNVYIPNKLFIEPNGDGTENYNADMKNSLKFGDEFENKDYAAYIHEINPIVEVFDDGKDNSGISYNGRAPIPFLVFPQDMQISNNNDSLKITIKDFKSIDTESNKAIYAEPKYDLLTINDIDIYVNYQNKNGNTKTFYAHNNRLSFTNNDDKTRIAKYFLESDKYYSLTLKFNLPVIETDDINLIATSIEAGLKDIIKGINGSDPANPEGPVAADEDTPIEDITITMPTKTLHDFNEPDYLMPVFGGFYLDYLCSSNDSINIDRAKIRKHLNLFFNVKYKFNISIETDYYKFVDIPIYLNLGDYSNIDQQFILGINDGPSIVVSSDPSIEL